MGGLGEARLSVQPALQRGHSTRLRRALSRRLDAPPPSATDLIGVRAAAAVDRQLVVARQAALEAAHDMERRVSAPLTEWGSTDQQSDRGLQRIVFKGIGQVLVTSIDAERAESHKGKELGKYNLMYPTDAEVLQHGLDDEDGGEEVIEEL